MAQITEVNSEIKVDTLKTLTNSFGNYTPTRQKATKEFSVELDYHSLIAGLMVLHSNFNEAVKHLKALDTLRNYGYYEYLLYINYSNLSTPKRLTDETLLVETKE